MTDTPRTTDAVTRRTFVRTAAAVSAGAALPIGFAAPAFGRAGAKETLRVGLIGCGGRGTGAAMQALTADDDVVLYAMGDMFTDRLDGCLNNLTQANAGNPGRVDVPESRRFTGFDAYQDVIDSGVDVVILTTPPHFRPQHLEAAVAANKHVFCEKPMAVDALGVHRVLAAAEEAKRRDLSLMSGFCWRYSYPERDTFQRIHDGAIGDVRSVHVTYHTGPLGARPRQPEWTDMEWQLRNWWHFTWLSGDHLVEQACHSIDKINWAMQGAMPTKCTALGGRGNRSLPEHGNAYDHFAVIYEYDNGVRAFCTARQQANCANDNTDYIMGATGTCYVNGWGPTHVIKGENPWRRPPTEPRPNMYQVEHDELFAAIRSRQPVNDGVWMSNSTMMAVMGRMAAYTGQTITWEQAMASQLDLTPPAYALGDLAVPEIAKPGMTKFV